MRKKMRKNLKKTLFHLAANKKKSSSRITLQSISTDAQLNSVQESLVLKIVKNFPDHVNREKSKFSKKCPFSEENFIF
jgi:hypothetical protein